MFEEFMGIPAHPLFIHAAVVFVPLLALVAIAYGIIPFLRPHLRLVLAVLALIAPGAALLAKLSGEAFFRRLTAKGMAGGALQVKIEQHSNFGNLTVYSTAVLAVITLVMVYFVAPRRSRRPVPVPVSAGSREPAGDGAADGEPTGAAALPPVPPRDSGARTLLLVGLSVVAAGVSLYFCLRTGDSGAKAVWTGF